MTDASSTNYYLRDGLGSTTNLTSQSGQTQWTWSYEPFGSIRTETKADGTQPDNPMKFTGEYLDPTGLYHLRARQYDPAVGRFLTRDPADQTVNKSVISAYAYAGNRPTVMVDPSGETFIASRRGQGAGPIQHFVAELHSTSEKLLVHSDNIPALVHCRETTHGSGTRLHSGVSAG